MQGLIMGRWKEIPHTADLALHVWGSDLLDLFATAARAMMSFVAVPAQQGGELRARVQLEALDTETLLVDWLGELLFLLERERAVFVTYDFDRVTPHALSADLTGRPVGTYLANIKAVTYHNLAVVQTEEGYETEVVFDV